MTKSGSRNLKSEMLRELRSHPAVRNYMLFCLAALFLLVVCLAERGLEWWCLLPALIGCVTLLANWSHGPPLVLLSLAGLLGMSGPHMRGNHAGWARFQTPTLMDLVLCISVLAYVLGHYRLLSLMRNIFPLDPRTASNDPLQRRSPDLVTGGEMALLGLVLPVWTGLAVMIWVSMMMEEEMEIAEFQELQGLGYRVPLIMASKLRLVWAGLAALATAGIATGYLRHATASPEESLLYLQDQCWRQTRREQSSLNRWLVWARLRARRRRCVPKQSLGTRGQS